jgi:hypothetical protein
MARAVKTRNCFTVSAVSAHNMQSYSVTARCFTDSVEYPVPVTWSKYLDAHLQINLAPTGHPQVNENLPQNIIGSGNIAKHLRFSLSRLATIVSDVTGGSFVFGPVVPHVIRIQNLTLQLCMLFHTLLHASSSRKIGLAQRIDFQPEHLAGISWL